MTTSRGGHRARQARQGDTSDTPSNAYQLLGGGRPASIDPTPEGLADLEATRLVITPDYVGPPRRRDDRLSDPDQPASPAEAEVVEPIRAGRSDPGAEGQRSILRPYHLVVAVLVTVVVVVPLTLVAAHLL